MNKQIKIKIAGCEYTLKQSFRGLMLFEQTQNKTVELAETIEDVLMLFYCMLKSCNKETFAYTFEGFVDALDESGTGVEVFTDFMKNQAPGSKI
jgi:hypothetical protein